MPARNAPLFAFTLSLAAAEALAQARPLSTAMSCRQAAGMVHARGALVLGTGVHTYDRFVRDRSFCEITEYIEPGFAPTLDHAQCFVGYTCKEPIGSLRQQD